MAGATQNFSLMGAMVAMSYRLPPLLRTGMS